MFNPDEKDEVLPRESTINLEGDFSVWNYLLTIQYPNTIAVFNNSTLKVDEIREILYILHTDLGGDFRFSTWNLRTGLNLFLSPALVNYTGAGGNTTLTDMITAVPAFYMGGSRQRYVILGLTDGFNVEIWKDGALEDTINIQTVLGAGRFVDIVFMSRSGRFVIVTSFRDILIYEGV